MDLWKSYKLHINSVFEEALKDLSNEDNKNNDDLVFDNRIVKEGTIEFNGETYLYIENEDGSKIIYKDRDKSGFKITIRVSGDPEEHKEGLAAVQDFFIKSFFYDRPRPL